MSDRSLLSPTGVELLFVLLGLVAVGSALLVVTTRQLVHAALWLVVTLGALAGCYLVLSAEFVAWVQVLIYVGAVVVLLLFGLMLTRAPIGRRPISTADRCSGSSLSLWRWPRPARWSTVVVAAFGSAYIELGDNPTTGTARSVGEALFRSWVLPFEALSVLLLAALIGAIVLSRTRE